MRRFLIITHGTLAEGFQNTLSFITGAHSNVTSINAFINNISLDDLTNDFMQTTEPDDEIIVLTDLMGGSVNQFFLKSLEREHFHLITGINLALLISLVFYPENKYFDADTIIKEVTLAREQIVYMNAHINNMNTQEIEND